MGLGGISIWQLLIILAIVVLLFGTKKLRNVGGDLGAALKNFKGAMKDGEKEQDSEAGEEEPASLTDASKSKEAGAQKSESAEKESPKEKA